MKFWTKVIIIGTITFIGLSVIGFFISSGFEDDSKKVGGDSNGTYYPTDFDSMTEEQQQEFLAGQTQARRKAGGKAFDLDNQDTVDFLEENGITIILRLFTFLTAKENPVTQEVWLVDSSVCSQDVIDI